MLKNGWILIPAGMMLAGCSTQDLREADYHAYGDSITYGKTLESPSTQAYPALVAEFENVRLANYAIPGDQACDIPTRQVFAQADSPTLSLHRTYSVLIGTNDADRRGNSAYTAVFALCHQATLSWLAVPAEYKVLATDAAVKTTGAGAIDTANNWNAWTTAGQGSTVSFPITTTKSGPIYLWPRISDEAPATYAYSLDSVVQGTASTKTLPNIATGKGTTDSLGFIRLAPVPGGRHAVTFTQVSVGTNGVSVVGIGVPRGTELGVLPTVLAGTVPYQYKDGQCTFLSDEPCLAYTQEIEADVSLFAGDGLDVRLFDTHKYMYATAKEMSDALHPNALGQVELSHAVEAVW